MVKCARCDRDVDTVQTVTPDVITTELIDSVDNGGEDLAGRERSLDVCDDCIEELIGE